MISLFFEVWSCYILVRSNVLHLNSKRLFLRYTHLPTKYPAQFTLNKHPRNPVKLLDYVVQVWTSHLKQMFMAKPWLRVDITSQCQIFEKLFIFNHEKVPSRELPYSAILPGENENHLQKCLARGHVRSQEGRWVQLPRGRVICVFKPEAIWHGFHGNLRVPRPPLKPTPPPKEKGPHKAL